MKSGTFPRILQNRNASSYYTIKARTYPNIQRSLVSVRLDPASVWDLRKPNKENARIKVQHLKAVDFCEQMDNRIVYYTWFYTCWAHDRAYHNLCWYKRRTLGVSALHFQNRRFSILLSFEVFGSSLRVTAKLSSCHKSSTKKNGLPVALYGRGGVVSSV